MRVIEARNVCEALPAGLQLLLRCGVREASRAGPVLVAPWPVTTVYERPQERVLYSAVRDANPFFHLMESLWMLAGRDDAAFLNRFVANFGERFAESASGKPNDENGSVHGAYGHRWRRALGYDQLDYVVGKLRADPSSRQCVVQMWDAMPQFEQGSHDYPGSSDESLYHGSDDLRGSWKDRPCNTHVYLRVRRGEQAQYASDYPPMMHAENTAWTHVLDITVCCRSNDVVWGAYGANAVHFSVLQEYLAARVGVGVGRYYQVSNNFHVYENELERLKDRGEKVWPYYSRDYKPADPPAYHADIFVDERHLRPRPLVDNPAAFDEELRQLLAAYENLEDAEFGSPAVHADVCVGFSNYFLSTTAYPALAAHRAYKAKQWEACNEWLSQIISPDWYAAMTEWVERRRR
jgi:thymidylate synthase